MGIPGTNTAIFDTPTAAGCSEDVSSATIENSALNRSLAFAKQHLTRLAERIAENSAVNRSLAFAKTNLSRLAERMVQSSAVNRLLTFAKTNLAKLAGRMPGRRRMVALGAAAAMVIGPASFAMASSPAAPAVAAASSQHTAAAAPAPATPASGSQQQAAAQPAQPAQQAAAQPAQPAAAQPAQPAAAQPAQTATTPAASTPAPAAPVAAKSNPYQGSTQSQLEPTGTYGYQETFSPDTEQWDNARAITAVAEQRNMPVYAAVIAVATALQESTLQNLTSAVDHDSLGLFQQRPSMGWGSASQLTDPSYAANAFLSAMQQQVPDYQQMSLWQAAQDTQRSGFPTAYAKWENQAAQMVQQVTN